MPSIEFCCDCITSCHCCVRTNNFTHVLLKHFSGSLQSFTVDHQKMEETFTIDAFEVKRTETHKCEWMHKERYVAWSQLVQKVPQETAEKQWQDFVDEGRLLDRWHNGELQLLIITQVSEVQVEVKE